MWSDTASLVELGGEPGAKVAIVVFFVLPMLLVFAAVIGSFVLDIGTMAPPPIVGVPGL